METKRALVQDRGGSLYVVEYVATYDADDNVTGTRIVRAAGPFPRALLGHLEPSRELFDRIDAVPDLQESDAAWLQAEDESGGLTYPIGVR